MDAAQLDGVVGMAKAINEFGALVIGLAAFMFIALVAVFIIFSRQKKMNADKDANFKELFSEMMKDNTEMKQHQQDLLAQFMQAAIQPKAMSEGIDAAVKVQEHLKYALATTKADRIAIDLFHDGQRTVKGQHILKFTCQNEYAAIPRYARIQEHKDVQISCISDICEMMSKGQRWEALTEGEVKASALAAWRSDVEIKSAFAQPIFASDGAVLGFVLMEYIISPIVPAWVDRARDEIKSLSDKVSIAMEYEAK